MMTGYSFNTCRSEIKNKKNKFYNNYHNPGF